jgi:hypothetical protein
MGRLRQVYEDIWMKYVFKDRSACLCHHQECPHHRHTKFLQLRNSSANLIQEIGQGVVDISTILNQRLEERIEERLSGILGAMDLDRGEGDR